MAQSVEDVALLLDIIAGKDSKDNYTLIQPWDTPPSFVGALKSTALQGKRIGVVWLEETDNFLNMPHFVILKAVKNTFDHAMLDLETAGAELVRLTPANNGNLMQSAWANMNGNMSIYFTPDKKEEITEYMDLIEPGPDSISNISALLECLGTDPPERGDEFPPADMEIDTNRTSGSLESWEAYIAASGVSRSLTVDRIKEHNLDAIASPTDYALAIASSPGLPIITVPMGVLGHEAKTVWDKKRISIGTAPGFPLGSSFIGDKWSDETLIGIAYAYEQATQRRKALSPAIMPVAKLNTILEQRTWSRGNCVIIQLP